MSSKIVVGPFLLMMALLYTAALAQPGARSPRPAVSPKIQVGNICMP